MIHRKKVAASFLILVTYAVIAKAQAHSTEAGRQQQAGVTFTKNKGQVCDSYCQPNNTN